jgi:hypothetical protein
MATAIRGTGRRASNYQTDTKEVVVLRVKGFYPGTTLNQGDYRQFPHISWQKHGICPAYIPWLEKGFPGQLGAQSSAMTAMNTDLQIIGEIPKTFALRLYEKIVSLPPSRKKALEYLGLFALLTAIYYCYFVRGATVNACSADTEITLSQLGLLMLKFLVFTGWPFTVLAFFDPTWRSKDAGNVFLASYVTTNVLWYYKTGCGFCIFAAWFRIVPYILCAWLAHGLGALRFRSHGDE